MSERSFMQQLELHGNEMEVRERIAKGQYHGEHLGIALEWLRRKDEERASASASKRDAREEEILEIAREANRIASNALVEACRANRSRWKDRTIAITAIIIAAIAARDDIKWLISWLIDKFKTS